MKYLVLLLILPLMGTGQIQINPESLNIDSVWSSKSSKITTPTISGSAILGMSTINTNSDLHKQTFNKIDTIYGIVEYLVSIDSNTYEKKIVNGYKVDSVFSRIDIGSCPNPMGANISCAVLHYQTYYTRNTFQVFANGREINRYKYYTFIPKQ